jgi:hypothetical protein
MTPKQFGAKHQTWPHSVVRVPHDGSLAVRAAEMGDAIRCSWSETFPEERRRPNRSHPTRCRTRSHPVPPGAAWPVWDSGLPSVHVSQRGERRLAPVTKGFCFNPRPALSARRTWPGALPVVGPGVSTHAPLCQRGERVHRRPLKRHGLFQPTPRFVSEANCGPRKSSDGRALWCKNREFILTSFGGSATAQISVTEQECSSRVRSRCGPPGKTTGAWGSRSWKQGLEKIRGSRGP